MRLISQVSREYKGTEYKKFWVIIPNKLIDDLKWKEGEELQSEVKNGKLIIERGT